MSFPIVYDKTETEYTGFGIAVLHNASEVKVSEKLNGEFILDLVLPRNDPNWVHINTDNFIKVDDQIFIIRTTEEIRDEKNSLVSNIQCEFIIFELLDKYVAEYEGIAVTAQAFLDSAFSGTRFVADASALVENKDVYIEDANAVKAINEACRLWECDYYCSGLPNASGNFVVYFTSQRGSDNGVFFEYRKNLRTIKRITDARGLITRLYVYGKDGLGIEAVNGGLAYIDSANFGNYPRAKEGSVRFPDIDDLNELLAAGQSHLADVDSPKYTYVMKIAELKGFDRYGSAEAFEVGDIVTGKDDELGIDVQARIVEYIRYPYELERSEIAIANYIDNITDYMSELDDIKRVMEQVVYRRRISTNWFSGVIDVLQNQLKASGSYATAEVLEDQGFLLENTDNTSPDYGALYLGPGIFAIADAQVNGNWDWRTFGKGSGFYADEIVSGTLRGIHLEIGSGESIFKADSSGIYLGASTFLNAPFSVNMAGDMKATSATIEGNVTITSGSININGGVFSVDPSGNLVATSATIIGDITAGAGSSISGDYINGGTITGVSLNIGGSFQVDSLGNVVATSMDITGGSINLGSGVFQVDAAGNLVANSATITGGSISGVTINVSEDVVIGDNLIIDPNNFGAGIQWGVSNPDYEIYIDPAGGSMTLVAQSEIFLNVGGIDYRATDIGGGVAKFG